MIWTRLALLLFLLGVGPARAQQGQVTVIPSGVEVAVPARGVAAPRPAAGLRRVRVARLAPLQPARESSLPSLTSPYVLGPLAAAGAAALAATLAGGGSSGGGVSAPVRTR